MLPRASVLMDPPDTWIPVPPQPEISEFLTILFEPEMERHVVPLFETVHPSKITLSAPVTETAVSLDVLNVRFTKLWCVVPVRLMTESSTDTAAAPAKAAPSGG